jgi:hypothetical protein
MSTFAVEKFRRGAHLAFGSWFAPVTREVEMRIVETAAAGVIALVSQFLVIAAVLI